MEKVFLPVVGDKVLIFELEDVKKLRHLGIVGVLSGTLSAAPQQNVFLGLPLQLSLEDVIWLVTNEHGILIDSAKYHEVEAAMLNQADWNSSQRICVHDPKQDEELLKKLAKMNLSDDKLILKKKQLQENKVENFIIIPNVTPLPNIDSYTIPLDKFLSLSNHHELISNYQVYRSVKDQGFFILPGIRFGGKYIGYPNDPLRYHAHFIINQATDFKLIDLVAGGRLATGVKKVWVIVGEHSTPDSPKKVEGKKRDAVEVDVDQTEPQPDIVDQLTKESKLKSFSIEWAGFG
ncbi:tRNA-splicing endonuclease subunit Sen34p [[Candida] railenensis]|uniref:tRNA-splicing endonuclease subunit Sen34 n=1 Tax=[Candida] railenensis TaxID=45579 RepID=A0A9P0W069_9ASCO|nr:tRNA-splicing endonuclease subunit Sen34p [[Candida] railenensis]